MQVQNGVQRNDHGEVHGYIQMPSSLGQTSGGVGGRG